MPGGPPPLPKIAYPAWLERTAVMPAPALGSGGPGLPGSKANPLTAAQAQALFSELAANPKIPFDFPDDGCYARAHLMCLLMQRKGVDSGKAWNYGHKFEQDPARGDICTLRVETRHHPKGAVTWRYHVAPVVYVQDSSGRPARFVIDPSIDKNGPIDAREWQDRQGDGQARLEFSGPEIYYKTPDALLDGTRVRPTVEHDTPNYEKTFSTLADKTRERDRRKAMYPALFQ
jgi:hypothetical protein